MPLRRFPVLLSIFVLLSLLTRRFQRRRFPSTPDPELQSVPVTGSVTCRPASAEAGP
ncbi:MAG: hypothetical protein IPH09_15245 [bacterium]|nr:hypothetical protein [bacterium]